MSKPAWLLVERATSADIPGMLKLSSSCLYDRHTQMKAVAKGYGTQLEDVDRYHSQGGAEFFESRMQDPKYQIVVAKDTSNDNKVVGSVIWARQPPESSEPRREETQEPERRPVKPDTTSLSPFEPSHEGPKTVQALERTTSAAMNYYKSFLMPPGTTCWFIVSISVDPANQRKGVGTALMKWGLDKADAEGLSSWVSSSHDGVSAFEKRGFHEVGRLELCLDDWAGGVTRPKSLIENSDDTIVPETSAWGSYVWTWLVRVPQQIGS